MLRRRLIILILLFTIFKSSPCSANQSWSLPVTPFGQPIIVVTLHEFKQPEFVSKIVLTHDLTYDGLIFKSRCYAPALSSRLIKSSVQGHFLWRDLNGNEILLNTASTEARFHLSKTESNHWLIWDEVSSKSYEYKNCNLIKVIENFKEYVFNYNSDGLLTEVTRTKPTFELLMSISHDKSGNPSVVTIEDKEYVFKCTLDNGITSCSDKASGLKLFGSEYNNFLITHWQTPDTGQTYTWGEVAWNRYADPIFIKSPIIIEDNNYRYHAKADLTELTFICIKPSGDPVQAWRYAFGSGKLHVATCNDKNEDAQQISVDSLLILP